MNGVRTIFDRAVTTWVCLSAMLVLVVAAARVGIPHAHATAPVTNGSPIVEGAAAATFTAAVCGVAMIVASVVRRPRRRRADEPLVQRLPLGSRWPAAVAFIIVLGGVAGVATALVATGRLRSSGSGGRPAPENHPATSAPRPTPHRPIPHRQASGGPHDAVLLVAAAAIVVAVILLIVAARRARRQVGDLSAADELASSPVSAELIQHTVARARRAIATPGSARAAVIDSYVAMSRGISEAGGKPMSRLTPRRMLEQSADAGLVDWENAEVVTTVFERARFSKSRITEDDRRRVETALERIQDPVSGPARGASR